MTNFDPNRPSVDTHTGPHGDVNAPPPGVGGEPLVHDAAPVRSGAQARQANRGRPVLYVLVAGLVLAMMAWAVAEFSTGGASRLSDSGGPRTTGTTNQQPTAGGIPLSPPVGSPEAGPSGGQGAPPATGQGSTSAPSPSSDSAR